jgi:hypothetical protein
MSSTTLALSPNKQESVKPIDLTCHEDHNLLTTPPVSPRFLKRLNVTVIPFSEPPQEALQPFLKTIQTCKYVTQKLFARSIKTEAYHQSISYQRLETHNEAICATYTLSSLLLDFKNEETLPLCFKTVSFFDRRNLLTNLDLEQLDDDTSILLKELQKVKKTLKAIIDHPLYHRSKVLSKETTSIWVTCQLLQKNIRKLLEDLYPEMLPNTSNVLPKTSQSSNSLPFGRLKEINTPEDSRVKHYKF